MQYDVFISHASEDKETFVEPLANALKMSDLNVWYDRFELKLGDSLRVKIDQGLASSRYGVVVLSKNFFAKNWPRAELDALVSRENAEGKKVILPVWHEVEAKDVEKFSPILASKLAVRSSDGIDVVVTQILDVCNEETESRPTSVFQVGTDLGLREKCFGIIRQENLIEWRRFVAELTQSIPAQLIDWKKIGEPAARKGGEDWKSAVTEAAKICFPGFVPMFAAIETGNKDFWKESVGILRRLSILENEMGGGATWALHIGKHMLYVAGTLGMAIAANLKLLDFIDEWMQLKMPDRHEGERIWLQIRSAHFLPEGIGFDIQSPFIFLKNIFDFDDMQSFFPDENLLVENILMSNIICSLIELRNCSQDQKCLDALMNQTEYLVFDVWPVWCILPEEKFRLMTLNLFGDSQGLIRFIYPSGFMTIDKFWPLWKKWKQMCFNLWWRSSSGRYDFLMKIPWMLLPGEIVDSN